MGGNGVYSASRRAYEAYEVTSIGSIAKYTSGSRSDSVTTYKEHEKEVERLINAAWQEFRAKQTEENYYETIGRLIESYSPEGRITAEFRAKPLAKELLAGEKLAANGHILVYLAQTDDGKHADILMDGVQTDIKRIESSKRGKVYQRIKDAAKQADAVVIDLTLRTISVADAVSKAKEALDNGVLRRGSITILDWEGNETKL